MHIVCAYRVLICVLVAGAWPGVEVLFNENKDLAMAILYIAADEQLDQGWVAALFSEASRLGIGRVKCRASEW